MRTTVEQANKALVLEGFDTLFNKRDYEAAARFWSPNYIQHSAHIAPGRDGLFNLIKGLPPTLRYEPGLIIAEGEFVILHGRFSGLGLPAGHRGNSRACIAEVLDCGFHETRQDRRRRRLRGEEFQVFVTGSPHHR